ncbi:MAG: radical SAM protein [Gammaproteobacteria bacterium]|nr:radical SAM protein [Gammaproteobacteria bacterium]
MLFGMDPRLPHKLHLELTERCNAACPMCARRVDGGQLNPHLADREITRALFEQFFNREFLQHLIELRLCGNFGDPAVAQDTLAICEHFRAINPSAALIMHTNGSVRSSEWWFRLGRLFKGKHDAVLFALDGLQDTHSVYRRDTSWQRIIENADAFMRGGGNAHWVFLVFEHNQHQVDEARTLAKTLGFRQFTLKFTKRFRSHRTGKLRSRYPIKDQTQAVIGYIKPPSIPTYLNPVVTEGSLTHIGEVCCRAILNSEIYVSAEGLVFPCCWTASAIYPATTTEDRGEIGDLIRLAGGKETISLKNHSLNDILQANTFLTGLASRWHHNAEPGPAICVRICGQTVDAFKAQFQHQRL